MNSRRHSGFTLIEVVVAMAILALSLGAIYESLAFGLRRAAQTSVRERALLNAQSLLSELRARGGFAVGSQQGTTGDGMPWTTTIEPYSMTAAGKTRYRAYQVAVDVQWNGHRKLHLNSIELGKAPDGQ